jgi:CRP/FNR family transcriptional regulator, anaerobic regulatory protein
MFDDRERQPLRPDMHAILSRGEGLLARAFAARPRTAATHTPLVDPYQPGREILRLRSGWACRSRTLPGDFIGLEAAFGDGAADLVMALTPVTCQAMPVDRLADLLDEPEVALRLWHERERELQRIEALTTKLARGCAEERMTGFLLHLCERLRHRRLVTGSSFRLPLTQQEIGDHLGLTVVHVNRVLRSLREQGIVQVRNRVAEIIDPERLAQAAARTTSEGMERNLPARPAPPPPLRTGLVDNVPSAQVASAALGIRAPAASSPSWPGPQRRG